MPGYTPDLPPGVLQQLSADQHSNCDQDARNLFELWSVGMLRELPQRSQSVIQSNGYWAHPLGAHHSASPPERSRRSRADMCTVSTPAVPPYPVHARAVERAFRAVTEASEAVVGEETRNDLNYGQAGTSTLSSRLQPQEECF